MNAETTTRLKSHLRGPELLALEKLSHDALTNGASWFLTYFASVPRRVGRRLLEQGRETLCGYQVELGSFRAADVVGALLLLQGQGLVGGRDASFLQTIHDRGDAEERRMVLKSLPLLDLERGFVVSMLEMAHRTNDPLLFEAAMLDSDLPASVLDAPAFGRLILKVAFWDYPIERVLGFESAAPEALGPMLLDFRSERIAAGRPTWRDTDKVLAAIATRRNSGAGPTMPRI